MYRPSYKWVKMCAGNVTCYAWCVVSQSVHMQDRTDDIYCYGCGQCNILKYFLSMCVYVSSVQNISLKIMNDFIMS